MTDGVYRTIVADPPWRVNRPNGWGQGTSASTTYMPYQLMKVEEIKALRVGDLCRPPAHLYLWTVNRHLEDAYSVARSWGFNPSTLLTWVKSPRGMGPGGHYASTTEFCLFCRRGVEGKNPAKRHPTSWFDWPRGAHSVKPDAFMDMVETISPPPYLEMFARRVRPGWDSWGNEVVSEVEIASELGQVHHGPARISDQDIIIHPPNYRS